jgi:O-antigen/teichoic acid export membrane protein
MKVKLKSVLKDDGAFLFISTILVNAGNYAINLILGRVLGPDHFAEISVIATGVLMLSFFAVGLQLTVAKYSATYFAEDNETKLHAFIKWISNKSFLYSAILSIALIMLSWQLQSFFHFSSVLPFIIVLIGIPLYFDFSLSRGLMQGTNQFKKLAMTYLIEMVVRLLFTFLFVITALRLADNWITEAVSVGFLFSFIATYIYGKRDLIKESMSFPSVDITTIRNFALIIGAYELSQIMINNSDIMLVKHFFINSEAGLYAALALIGRVVFFATWTIVTLLFPKVIQKEKKGEKHAHLFWGALGIVAFIGLSIIVTCFFMGDLIISILFGSGFSTAAPLLWKYACATTLFASANVFAYYYMSLNKYTPVVISVIAGISQIVLLMNYHNTLDQVIGVQIALMSLLFAVMTIYHLYHTLLGSKSKELNGIYNDNLNESIAMEH